jgi:replicative superfamily II helicase
MALYSAFDAVEALPTHELTFTSAALRASPGEGMAFNNTNLRREQKAVVERALRYPDSAVRVLAATTTVADGINTTASAEILAELRFIGEDGHHEFVNGYALRRRTEKTVTNNGSEHVQSK